MKHVHAVMRLVQYKMFSPLALHLYCFVLAYLLVLALLAPASLVSLLVRQTGMPEISLVAPSGRLWNGQAEIWLHAGQPQQASALGTLAWHLQNGLSTQPNLHLRWNGQSAGLIKLKLLDLTHFSVQVQQLKLSLPADTLGKLSPLLMPLGLQGHLHLECPDFALDGQGWHGKCLARMAQVQSSLTSIRPLGDYQLTLLADGQQATLEIDTLQGKLQLQGTGQLTLTQAATNHRFSMRPATPESLTMNGIASTDAEHQQGLQGLLRVLGNPSVNNSVNNTRFRWGFTWQGS